MRRKTVRLKLNTIRSEFHGKNVLLIDDSIVRGTTSMELVQMARDAGAKKVSNEKEGERERKRKRERGRTIDGGRESEEDRLREREREKEIEIEREQ